MASAKHLLWNSLAFIVLACARTASGQPSLTLGVVEEVREPGESGDSLTTNVRLAFSRKESEWSTICESKPNASRNQGCTFPSAEKDTKWTVYYQGRQIGSVTTNGWLNSDYYSKTGLLRITSKATPRIGRRTNEFGSWVGQNTYRPLIAFIGSEPNAGERWRPVPMTSGPVDTAITSQFRKVIATIPSCKTRDGQPVGREISVASRHLEIFRTFVSGRNDRLIGVRVRGSISPDCDGPEPFRSELWFYVEVGSLPRMLSAPYDKNNGPISMTPVDFGDFDGDGTTEAIFWLSGYNEDGYVLFYDGFKKRVSFTWGYH